MYLAFFTVFASTVSASFRTAATAAAARAPGADSSFFAFLAQDLRNLVAKRVI